MSSQHISEEAEEEWAARDFWPDHDQTKELLSRYFEGDISDSYVAGVLTGLQEAIDVTGTGDRRDVFGSFRSYMESPHFWKGTLWYESVPGYRRHFATPAEYHCIIAHCQYSNDPSKPYPKPFLPTQFVGQWVLRKPIRLESIDTIWDFAPDGSFVIHGGRGIWLYDQDAFFPKRWRATYSNRFNPTLDLLFVLNDRWGGDVRDERKIRGASVVGNELWAHFSYPYGDADTEILLERLDLR